MQAGNIICNLCQLFLRKPKLCFLIIFSARLSANSVKYKPLAASGKCKPTSGNLKMTEIKNIANWKELIQFAENGDSVAQYEVGAYFDSGLSINEEEIIKEDKLEALQWFQQSHKNGNIDATIRVADYLSDGEHCEKNVELAIELYKRGIDKGYSYAAKNLATLYLDSYDFETSFEFYQIAQKLDKTNLIELALCYHFGLGTKKDKFKAFDIFQNISNDNSFFRNCEYEIEEANYYLGIYYLEGEVVKKSIDKARQYLAKANEDNDHRSANELLLIIGRNGAGETH